MKKIFSYSLLFIITLLCFTSAYGQRSEQLGKINFPNSGTPEAQADFLDGVTLLHNFEYADAARAFKRAQEIDPDFALAYWGEAKTYNHAIWMGQDRDAAIEVLERLGSTVEERQAKAPTFVKKIF